MIVIVVGYVESVEKLETSDSEAIFEDLAFRKNLVERKISNVENLTFQPALWKIRVNC